MYVLNRMRLKQCSLNKPLLLYHFYTQAFTGNTDRTTVVENRLSTPVIARCIRVLPLTWSTDNACMRMEVLGCVHA